MPHLEGLAPVVDVELGIPGHRAGVDAERGEPADEGVDGHPEDLRQHPRLGIGLDLHGGAVGIGERRRVRVGRARHEPGEHVEQQADPRAGGRGDEAHGNEVPRAERGPERGAELVGGDFPLIEVGLHQRLVHFHRLVHHPALRLLDRGELGGGGRVGVEEAVHHLLPAGRRQAEGKALRAEDLLKVPEERREVQVRRIDLVHDDEAREAARGRRLHHPAGGGLDAGPRVHDHRGGLHRGEGGQRPAEEVRIPGRVDEADVGRIVGETRDRVPQRLLVRPFLGLVVAGRGALLHRAGGGDGSRRRQQRLDERGLAAAAVADDRDVADLPRGVIRHPVSPVRSRRRTVEYIRRLHARNRRKSPGTRGGSAPPARSARPLRPAGRKAGRGAVSRGVPGEDNPASASPRGGCGCARTRTHRAPPDRARRAGRRRKSPDSRCGRRARPPG